MQRVPRLPHAVRESSSRVWELLWLVLVQWQEAAGLLLVCKIRCCFSVNCKAQALVVQCWAALVMLPAAAVDGTGVAVVVGCCCHCWLLLLVVVVAVHDFVIVEGCQTAEAFHQVRLCCQNEDKNAVTKLDFAWKRQHAKTQ